MECVGYGLVGSFMLAALKLIFENGWMGFRLQFNFEIYLQKSFTFELSNFVKNICLNSNNCTRSFSFIYISTQNKLICVYPITTQPNKPVHPYTTSLKTPIPKLHDIRKHLKYIKVIRKKPSALIPTIKYAKSKSSSKLPVILS